MSTTTIGAAPDARPANDSPTGMPGLSQTAERRARALAPTVFCASTEIDDCIERSQTRRVS